MNVLTSLLFVYCLGDSITFSGVFGDNQSWPQQLQALEPSAVVQNAGIPGEGTDTGLLRLKYAITYNLERYPGRKLVFPILMGINDPTWDGCDTPPKRTAARLVKMSRYATRHGVIPIVLTLTPTWSRGSACPDLDWIAWHEEVNRILIEKGQRYRKLNVTDLHNEFGEDLAQWKVWFPDGVHPAATDTRTIMAEFVDRVLIEVAQP